MIITFSNLKIVFPPLWVHLEIVHCYFCFFCRWVLQLDIDGAIFYSTAPQWISSPLTQAPGQLKQLLPLFLVNHVSKYYPFMSSRGLVLSSLNLLLLTWEGWEHALLIWSEEREGLCFSKCTVFFIFFPPCASIRIVPTTRSSWSGQETIGPMCPEKRSTAKLVGQVCLMGKFMWER